MLVSEELNMQIIVYLNKFLEYYYNGNKLDINICHRGKRIYRIFSNKRPRRL